MIDTKCSAPDYLDAPFTTPLGSREWVEDARQRCERARVEFVKAASAIMTETDLTLAFALHRDLDIKADNLIRSKWMLREIIRATERLVEPFVVKP